MNITDIIPFDEGGKEKHTTMNKEPLTIIFFDEQNKKYYKDVYGRKVKVYGTWGVRSYRCEILIDNNWEKDNGNIIMTPEDLSEWLPSDDIPWPDYPKWAKWVAKDGDERWKYFDIPPHILKSHDMWTASTAFYGYIPPAYAPTITGDWKEMIFERPENL